MGTVEPLPSRSRAGDTMTLAAAARGPDAPARPSADLQTRAERLWPDGEPFAEHNRREWIRAVGVVRGTSGGWLVDRQAQRVTS